MFDPPDVSVDDIETFADWVELIVLTSEKPAISRTEIEDRLRDSSSIIEPSEDMTTNAEQTTEDSVSEIVEAAWRELTQRSRLLENRSMVVTDGLRAIRKCNRWTDCPAYVSLLLAQLCLTGYDLDISGYEYLFEKVVEAALVGLLRGTSFRFGHPPDPGLPRGVKNRVRVLADVFNLKVKDLQMIRPKDKDCGLDIVSDLNLGIGAGGLFILTQCATGQDWKKKKGDLSLSFWDDAIRWNASLVKAMAVPWRLRDPYSREWVRLRFEAVTLDLFRLLWGEPDKFLGPITVREKLTEWCSEQMQAMPSS
jgi:hypothetical protein